MSAMSYENKKKAQARMTAYWAKRRAEEAVQRLRLQGESEKTLVVTLTPEAKNTILRDLEKTQVFTAIRNADTGELISTTEPVAVKSAAPVPPARTSSRQYQIIANSDGMMVCENGPCLCGKGKREWHPICCKP